MTREHVRNFSGTCPQGPLGAGLPLPPRAPRRGGRRVWAGAALVLLLAAPVLAQTNTPPVITSATTFTLSTRNTTAGPPTLTATDATLTATDADADSLEWSIPTDGGADAEQFTLTSAGVLTFSTAPDYEAPADADTDHVYEVTVQVSDGTTPVTADLEITVENVTELTTMTTITGPATVDYAENQAVAGGHLLGLLGGGPGRHRVVDGRGRSRALQPGQPIWRAQVPASAGFREPVGCRAAGSRNKQ